MRARYVGIVVVAALFLWNTAAYTVAESEQVVRAHSRFPGHALTPTGVMAIRCKQFHLPDL